MTHIVSFVIEREISTCDTSSLLPHNELMTCDSLFLVNKLYV